MSSQDFCLCLTVKEFFSDCNWEGKPKVSDRAFYEEQSFNTPWQCLTVQEFFRLCSWQGQPKAENTRTSASHFRHQTAWQCQTVQEFFSQSNWQGRSSEDPTVQHLAPESHLKQQVKTFFQFLPWEGNPEIGAIPYKASVAPVAITDAVRTHIDLSELF